MLAKGGHSEWLIQIKILFVDQCKSVQLFLHIISDVLSRMKNVSHLEFKMLK
jgi:hypothetical protein